MPFATSVRALDALKRDGRIEAIGLCNVNLRQLQEARDITQIEAVQVELHPWHDANILSGVAGYCVVNGIRLVAYRPLWRPAPAARDRLRSGARRDRGWGRMQATPHEIVLDLGSLGSARAWCRFRGQSRVETAVSVARAATIVLTGQRAGSARCALPCRRQAAPGKNAGGRGRGRATARDGEIVPVMGLPAAGKSTVARQFVARGYLRVNRDDTGGSLRALLPALQQQIDAGATRLVLDNTYISRASRAPIIDAATRCGPSGARRMAGNVRRRRADERVLAHGGEVSPAAGA